MVLFNGLEAQCAQHLRIWLYNNQYPKFFSYLVFLASPFQPLQSLLNLAFFQTNVEKVENQMLTIFPGILRCTL